jgi:alpha-amylase
LKKLTAETSTSITKPNPGTDLGRTTHTNVKMVSSSTYLFTSLFLSLSSLAIAATTEEWKSRSIYQIMTDRFARTDGSTDAPCDLKKAPYCGGTWRGIINQLDYIQGMGFDAIYISPVTANLEGNTEYGEAYHGYWPTDLYAINEHFGTQDDLHALSDEVHRRGMYFMVDVVINDMGYATHGQDPATSIDYSVLTPFNNQKYYHPWCNITDFDNYTDAQFCWLGDDQVALPDLNTESQEVSDMMNDWAIDLIAKYTIDGFRVDAAKHVSDNFLKNFAAAAGIFTIGEVYEGDPYRFCPYQALMPSVTNYPNYFPMIEAFSKGNVSALTRATQITKKTCADTTTLATFSENHDLPRFPSYTKDLSVSNPPIQPLYSLNPSLKPISPS